MRHLLADHLRVQANGRSNSVIHKDARPKAQHILYSLLGSLACGLPVVIVGGLLQINAIGIRTWGDSPPGEFLTFGWPFEYRFRKQWSGTVMFDSFSESAFVLDVGVAVVFAISGVLAGAILWRARHWRGQYTLGDIFGAIIGIALILGGFQAFRRYSSSADFAFRVSWDVPWTHGAAFSLSAITCGVVAVVFSTIAICVWCTRRLTKIFRWSKQGKVQF